MIDGQVIVCLRLFYNCFVTTKRSCVLLRWGILCPLITLYVCMHDRGAFHSLPLMSTATTLTEAGQGLAVGTSALCLLSRCQTEIQSGAEADSSACFAQNIWCCHWRQVLKAVWAAGGDVGDKGCTLIVIARERNNTQPRATSDVRCTKGTWINTVNCTQQWTLFLLLLPLRPAPQIMYYWNLACCKCKQKRVTY